MAQNKIAETLKELRIHHGLTQDMLSSRLNISRQTLANYETGKRVPDPDSLCVLAEFYHVTLDQLIRTGLRPVATDPFASLPEEDRKFLQAYHCLSLDKQKSLREYLEFLGR